MRWYFLMMLIRGGELQHFLKRGFGLIEDKDQAWQDLYMLAQDEDANVRWKAADALELVFNLVPDKDQAWEDLRKLAQDEYHDVRRMAAGAKASVFSQVRDNDDARSIKDHRDLVWQDTHPLEAIIDDFRQDPDRAHAWKILHELIQSSGFWFTRSNAVYALGLLFDQIPDKSQAWQDLHKLAQDEYRDVRRMAAGAIVQLSVRSRIKIKRGEICASWPRTKTVT